MVETKRKNRKLVIAKAAVKLMAEQGANGATIRAIAREAGVTDAAIYRHYRSKDDLYWSAYIRITEEMIREKEPLLAGEAPISERLREWIRLTYRFYDQHPDAFSFVFIRSHDPPEALRDFTVKQSELFKQMLARAGQLRQIREMRLDLALCHFTGLMLNVPRMIDAGILRGPAGAYVDEVFDAAWRLLRPEQSGAKQLEPSPGREK